MAKNDNAHAVRLVDAITKSAGEEAANEFVSKFTLSKSAAIDKKYELCKNVMTDDTKRAGFDALAKQTFCLSFEEWYQNGEWSDWNQPYTLYDGEKAISNITVNQMKALYQGKVRNYIQLGGVMTDPAYRGQGLSKLLMNEVQKDWADKCDAMFLLANRSVTEFYPKFGFVEEKQYLYFLKAESKGTYQINDLAVRKLDLSKEEDNRILYRCYEKKNPFSEFQFIENSSLLKFYCHVGMQDSMYYLEREDAVIIADFEEDKIMCYDIYYDGKKEMKQLLELICVGALPDISFLFTPVDKAGLEEQEFYDEDTHLFVLDGKENVFRDAKLYIPDISHT